MLEATKQNIVSIETQRLCIREKDGHVDGLTKIFRDEKTMLFYPQFLLKPGLSIERLLDLLDGAEVYIYPLLLKGTETVIGFVTLNNIETYCKRIEVGYFLLSGYWHNGYASEALNAVVACLRKLGWHRIEATVYSGNEASQKVLLSCGFTLEGVLRDKYLIHEKYHDDIIYSIIVSDDM